MVREGFRFAQPRRGWRVMGWRGRAQRPWCRSPCVLRAVFFVLVRNNPSLRIASASQRIPVGPARRFPRTPSEKRHTNAYGCHESPFEPSINSLIHRQEVKERSSVGWVRRRNRQTPPASLPRMFASERHRLRHDRPRRRHVPRPHPPQRQENTRQGIRFPIRPGCVLSSCYRPVWREFSFRKSGRF